MSNDLQEWDIDRLIPYKNNAKIHTSDQITKIAKSINKYGLINPPTVEADGTIIAGHGRHLALIQLGWKTTPVFVRDDLSKSEAAAARLADNRVAVGDVNTTIIQEELRWLEKEFDDEALDAIGFDDRELAFLTEDLGTLDEELMNGLDLDVNSEFESSDEAIDKAEEGSVAITKILGFTEISVSESRRLAKFMAIIKEQMSTDDARTALINFINGVMADD